MNWFSRLIGKKESAVGPALAFGKLGRPVWTGRNYEAFAKEAYGQNIIAYRAIRLIAENGAAIPLLAYDAKGKEMPDHPVLKLLRNPNPWQSGPSLIDALLAFWRISGNCYLEGVALRGEMRELYVLRPDRMKVIPGPRGYPEKYQYDIGGRKFDFQMELPGTKQQPILHVRDFNPVDDYYGQSPIEAGAYAIDVHNAASGFNKALLDNAASPSGAFEVSGGTGENTLGDKQYSRLQQQMQDRYGGKQNAGKVMLLEGGLKWIPMGMTPKDLEFTDGKNQTAREIALAFGVPPMLLGIPGDNTYSNYREANRAFHRQTILPLMRHLLADISNWLQPSYPGLRLDIDVDQIDALAEEREAAWDRVAGATFLTLAEKREALGYGPYAPQEGKPDTYITIGGGLMPIEDLFAEADASGGPEPKPGEDDDLEDPDPNLDDDNEDEPA